MNPGQPAQASSRPDYFNLLTVLRGLAALAVTLYHLTLYYRVQVTAPPPLLAPLLPLLDLGWFGVDVFFLASGYGLAAKIADARKHAGLAGAAAFARNRFWRIYPVYWACCLVAVALAYGASHFNHLDWHAEFPQGFGEVLSSALLLQQFTGTPPLLPIVTWTLACELVFYVIVLVGILLRPRVGNIALVGAAVVLAFAGLSGGMPVLGWLFAFWPQFACGLLVYGAVCQRIRGETRLLTIVLGILALLAAIAPLAGNGRAGATALVALGLIAIWPADARLCRLPPARWLAWCGMVSYPLFLLHIPIASRLMNLSRRFVASDHAAAWLVLAGSLGSCVAASWAVHRWVELPAQRTARAQPLSAR